MSTVLVTGSSSGFGNLTVRSLAAAGHTVFASMRNVTKQNAAPAEALRAFGEKAAGSIEVLELDVTDDASVEQAVAAASAQAPLDVVINNAGAGVAGWAEAFSVEQMRWVFEVNLYGVHRVNRAVLPAMRARGDGLIIAVSSVLGRLPLPFSAPYVASKFALEGYTESLRVEVAPSGVDVVIVQPGGFGTGFMQGMLPAADTARVASYGEMAELQKQVLDGFIAMLSGPDAPDPQDVADAIKALVETPKGERAARTVVDRMMGDGARAINAVCGQVAQGALEGMGLGFMGAVKR